MIVRYMAPKQPKASSSNAVQSQDGTRPGVADGQVFRILG
jgi:hypothetical protein